jgi:hypothetical protein
MNDFLLDADYNLQIEDGDFVMGAADLQHVQLLIDTHKGEWKQYPLTGFGKERLINGVVDGAIRREIQQQLEADGWRLRRFDTDAALNIFIEI